MSVGQWVANFAIYLFCAIGISVTIAWTLDMCFRSLKFRTVFRKGMRLHPSYWAALITGLVRWYRFRGEATGVTVIVCGPKDRMAHLKWECKDYDEAMGYVRVLGHEANDVEFDISAPDTYTQAKARER